MPEIICPRLAGRHKAQAPGFDYLADQIAVVISF
jgi:hypothetical protein